MSVSKKTATPLWRVNLISYIYTVINNNKTMAKIKTHWDDIKDKETFYTSGTGGWEIHLRWTNEHTYNPKTNVTKESKRLQFCWPWRTGDGVSREEKSKARKEVMFKRFRDRVLASASANREEYWNLMQRVCEMNEQEFKEAIGEMRGFELRNYICQKYWTHSESFASFWRG